MRRAVDTHLSLHFKEYRHRIHQHWYHMMQDHGVEAAWQRPYDSITWMMGLSYAGITRIRHIRLHIQIFFKV